MKRLLTFMLSVFMIFSCSLIAFSFNINGIDNGAEWYDCEMIPILSGESNCKVNYGFIKWKIDAETSSLYICVQFKENDQIINDTNSGVILILQDSETFNISVNSSQNTYDVDKYSFEGAITVDESKGATCEMRIGMKYGIPHEINGKIRFIDSDGAPSNHYSFTIKNNENSEYNNQYYNSDLNNKHEKETTEKSITSKIENKTTKSSKTTTTKKNSENSVDLDWIIDMIIDEPTTQLSDNTKSSTETTTKKRKSEKVIISITKENQANNSTITSQVESTTQPQITSNDNKTDKNITISTSEGKKYKTMVAIAGCVALIVIVLIGSLNSFKKSNASKSEITETTDTNNK